MVEESTSLTLSRRIWGDVELQITIACIGAGGRVAFEICINRAGPLMRSVIRKKNYRMDAKARFSIRHMLLYTLVAAFLLAAPMHAHRVVLPHIGTGIAWLAYNGLVLATVAYPLWFFSGRRLAVPCISLLFFVVNFGPEVATVADFLITGNNDATGSWLAERGLDYDPLLSIPCWCSIADSG